MKKSGWTCLIISLLIINLTNYACTPSTITIITPSPLTPTNTPTSRSTPTPTPPPLPEGMEILQIDGIDSQAEYHPWHHTWVWFNKDGEIRRLVDPLIGHLLARTTSPQDHLSYEIDLALGWEVNLVNYLLYEGHPPYGVGYIQLLSTKYPWLFTEANEQTGIVFRIILENDSHSLDERLISYQGETKAGFNAIFLLPHFLPGLNQYVLTMIISEDFLTKQGALRTYTDLMLNYCTNPEYPLNPNGFWGFEIFKRKIK